MSENAILAEGSHHYDRYFGRLKRPTEPKQARTKEPSILLEDRYT